MIHHQAEWTIAPRQGMRLRGARALKRPKKGKNLTASFMMLPSI